MTILPSPDIHPHSQRSDTLDRAHSMVAPQLVAWRDNSPKFGLWQNLSMAKVRYRICIVATWCQAVKGLSGFMMTSHGWPVQHQRVLGRRMGDFSENGNFLVAHAGA